MRAGTTLRCIIYGKKFVNGTAVPYNDTFSLYVSTSDGVKISTALRALPENMELEGVSVYSETQYLERGRMFVDGSLYFNGSPVMKLFSDYVTSGQAVGYPRSGMVSSLSGVGYRREKVVNPMPANGTVPLDFTFESNIITNVIALRFQFNTDATVANRRLLIECYLGGGTVMALHSNIQQTASNNYYYYIYNSNYYTNATAAIANAVVLPLPISLGNKDMAYSLTMSNAVAGDTWLQAVAYVEQWIIA